MIYDSLSNSYRYNIPQLEKIKEFISKNNCLDLPNGQIDINSKDLFVKVMEYEPKPASENRFETHQVYADLQYVVSGVELMQVTPTTSLIQATEYDSIGDYQFYTSTSFITDIVVNSGQFVVFYPCEAHRPACVFLDNKSKVKKLVFKIKIN